MIAFGIPVGQILLGLVLGPYVEKNLRNGLTANNGNWTVFLTRPISAGLLLCMCALIYFFWYTRRSGRRLADQG